LFFLVAILSGSFADKNLLITFHGGGSSARANINNIYRYSLSGNLLSTTFVSNAQSESLRELRSMIAIPYQKILVFCNGYNKDSKIESVNVCGGAASEWASEGLSHPYGIAVDRTGTYVYVSNQDNDEIVEYYVHGQYENFFATVNQPRGLSFASDGNLYVASVGDDAVYGLDSSGNIVNEMDVTHPIDVRPFGNSSLVVSSDDGAGFVYIFDINGTLTGTLTHPQLGHPAGMAVDGNTLYVLAQKNFALFTFNLVTQKLINILLQNLPDIPEDITIINC